MIAINNKEINTVINVIDWSLRNGYIIPSFSFDKDEYEEIQSILRKLISSSNLSEDRIRELKEDYDL